MQELPTGKRNHREEKKRDKSLITDEWPLREIRCGTNRKCRIWKRFLCASDTTYKLLRVSLTFYTDSSAHKTFCRCSVRSPKQLNLDIFAMQMDWIRTVPRIKITLAIPSLESAPGLVIYSRTHLHYYSHVMFFCHAQ